MILLKKEVFIAMKQRILTADNQLWKAASLYLMAGQLKMKIESGYMKVAINN
jgi:hypothetical protein